MRKTDLFIILMKRLDMKISFSKKVLILLIFSILFLTSFISFKYVSIYKINGSSMAPTFEDGDYFLCSKNTHFIEKGDIIVYNESKKNIKIAHRVVEKINSKKFKTKGDNNNYVDQYIINQSEIKCVHNENWKVFIIFRDKTFIKYLWKEKAYLKY